MTDAIVDDDAAVAVERAQVRSAAYEHGPDHDETLLARASLARALVTARRFDEALTEMEELLRDRIRVCGPRHARTLVVRHNLADRLVSGGRVEDGIAEYRRVVEDSAEHDPTVDTTLGNLAITLGAVGEHEEAAALFRRALSVPDGSAGRTSHVLWRSCLGTQLALSGDYEGAIAELQQALADAEAADLDGEARSIRTELAEWRVDAGHGRPSRDVTDRDLATWERRAERLVRRGKAVRAANASWKVLEHRLADGASVGEQLRLRRLHAQTLGPVVTPIRAVHLYRRLLAAERRFRPDDAEGLRDTERELARYTGLAGMSSEATALYRRVLESDWDGWAELDPSPSTHAPARGPRPPASGGGSQVRAAVRRTAAVTSVRLVGAGLILLGTLASPVAYFLPVLGFLQLTQYLPGPFSDREPADAFGWVPDGWKVYLIPVWVISVFAVLGRRLGLRLVRRHRYRVVFLRKFGDTAANDAVTRAARRLGASWRFTTLDDLQVIPVRMNRQLTLSGRVVSVLGAITTWCMKHFGSIVRGGFKVWAVPAVVVVVALVLPRTLLATGSLAERVAAALSPTGFGGGVIGVIEWVLLAGVAAVGIVCVAGFALAALSPIVLTVSGAFAEVVAVDGQAVSVVNSGTGIALAEQLMIDAEGKAIANRLTVLEVDSSLWRETVDAIARRCDVALVDVSTMTANIEWEIGRLERLGVPLVRVGDRTTSGDVVTHGAGRRAQRTFRRALEEELNRAVGTCPSSADRPDDRDVRTGRGGPGSRSR